VVLKWYTISDLGKTTLRYNRPMGHGQAKGDIEGLETRSSFNAWSHSSSMSHCSVMMKQAVVREIRPKSYTPSIHKYYDTHRSIRDDPTYNSTAGNSCGISRNISWDRKWPACNNSQWPSKTGQPVPTLSSRVLPAQHGLLINTRGRINRQQWLQGYSWSWAYTGFIQAGKQIQQWELIDMAEIMPDVQLFGDKACKNTVVDILMWVQCFGTYVLVVSPSYPECILDRAHGLQARNCWSQSFIPG